MSLSHILYVGSYASTLSSLTLTVPTLPLFDLASLGSAPSWITQHGTTLYTADEFSQPYAYHSSYLIDATDPTTLHFKDELKVQHELGAVHLVLSSDHAHLYSANYVSGSVTHIPLDGRTGTYLHQGPAPQSIDFTGAGPVLERQKGPDAHQVVLEPRGQYLLVCDLGSDQIRVFDTQADSHLEPLDPIHVPAGSGPRHLVIVGKGTTQDPTLIYLVNELSNTLIIAHLNYPQHPSKHLTWDVLQTLSFLPQDQTTKGWLGGEVVVSPDRKYVFVSNRSPKNAPAAKGKDVLSIFTLDPSSGKVESEEPSLFELQGLHPRHMSLSSKGDMLAVALQHSDQVVVYKRQGKGLSLIGQVEVKKPTCVIWAQ
ncbi:BQ2448_3806 [Microbotryum intermedium]|uniref:BQ2448_3806 protein n=1 Tax=Microbotryum intermedium TaxID=269621 RepID=A0A238FGN0_9BASI|nr:BQ2448_3806 [Microbotryum intermedium]